MLSFPCRRARAGLRPAGGRSLASSSSSWAWARADLGVLLAGQHAGQFLCTRSASSSSCTSLEVKPVAVAPSAPRTEVLVTRMCWSAKAATCGRWVTTSTWTCRASMASRRADLDGGTAADAGVDLVEDEGGHGVHGGQHHLDGEHHAGELTAGGALAQRPGRARRSAAAAGRRSRPRRAGPAARRPRR